MGITTFLGEYFAGFPLKGTYVDDAKANKARLQRIIAKEYRDEPILV
jgi:hypothetical protein